ncbi:hypothetical protein ACRDNQ_12980 [Palleronia sp. KMU-117]|uniref:hypothetical protein n=1 Tax=Palleronia sp. KMU-117 TaxID=3434108 RepID=UPI003D738AA3
MSDAPFREATLADLPGCAMPALGRQGRRTRPGAGASGAGPRGLSLAQDGFAGALTLAAEERGHAIGKAQIRQARTIRSKGPDLVSVEPNPDACRFAAREGVVPLGHGRDILTDDGFSALAPRWHGTPA